METIFKILGVLIIIKLCWKYRWEIFGAYVEWVEPNNSEDAPVIYVSEQADNEYNDIRCSISSCSNLKQYQKAISQIYDYQEAHKGLIHEQRVNDMLGLLEEKYQGQQALFN